MKNFKTSEYIDIIIGIFGATIIGATTKNIWLTLSAGIWTTYMLKLAREDILELAVTKQTLWIGLVTSFWFGIELNPTTILNQFYGAVWLTLSMIAISWLGGKLAGPQKESGIGTKMTFASTVTIEDKEGLMNCKWKELPKNWKLMNATIHNTEQQTKIPELLVNKEKKQLEAGTQTWKTNKGENWEITTEWAEAKGNGIGIGDIILCPGIGWIIGWNRLTLLWVTITASCATLQGLYTWITRREKKVPLLPHIAIGCSFIIAIKLHLINWNF